MTDQTKEEVTQAALNAIAASRDFDGRDRTDYIEMLGVAAVEWMRNTEGVEYTRGWLEGAIKSLSQPSHMERLRASREFQ